MMDADFWKTAWEEGRTAFHQENFHEKLLKYFPALHPEKGKSVFVPLCGKTRDMIWLHDQGLQVRGIELHGPAIQAFFEENKLPLPKITMDDHYLNYRAGNITISCGDFFQVEEINFYDFVYDRAALVALPPGMRIEYARKIHQVLKPGGKYFLISYEHDELTGPPFNVTEKDIRALYEKDFSLTVLERDKQQSVYVLEKKP